MPDGSLGESDVRTLSDYARAVWRRKWLIAGVVILCGLAGYYYAWRQEPQYKASSVMIYRPPVDPANPLANAFVDPSIAQIALDSVANLVSSPALRRNAESNAGPLARPYDVSTTLNSGSTSGGESNSLTVTAVSTDAAESAAVANGYAEAVDGWSRRQLLARVRQAEAATAEGLKTFNTVRSRNGSSDYRELVQRMQDLRVLASTVTGQFQVLVPAVVPTAPFAPRPVRSAIVAFGGGLLAAAALVLLFGAFSTRVRGRQEVGAVLGLPIVGVIPEVSNRDLKRGKLVTLAQPESRAAEALRLLRSNLDYVNGDEVSSLLVTSCVAGEGKSTMVCNLAATLAMAGKRVVVVDGDLRDPRVHDYFGLSNEVGLTDVVAGKAKLADVLRPIYLPLPGRRTQGDNGSQPSASPASPRQRRLAVLTSGPRLLDPGDVVASERFGLVIQDLQNTNVDFVIVDSPALLEVGDAAAMAAQVEGLMMVVDLDKVARATLHEAKDLLRPLPCHKLGVVLVRVRPGRAGYSYDDHAG